MSASKQKQQKISQGQIKTQQKEPVQEFIFSSAFTGASSDSDSFNFQTATTLDPSLLHKPPVKARNHSNVPSSFHKADHYEMSSISITPSEFDELITHAFADESLSRESPSERESLIRVQTLKESALSLDEHDESRDAEPWGDERGVLERGDDEAGFILHSVEEKMDAFHQEGDSMQAAGQTPSDFADQFLDLDSSVMSPPQRIVKEQQKRSTAIRKKKYVTWHCVSSVDFNQVQYHGLEGANAIDSTPFSSRITFSTHISYSRMTPVEQRYVMEPVGTAIDTKSGNKGFVRYSSCVRRQFQRLYPDHSNKEIMNMIANAWRNLSKAEKDYFRSPSFSKQLRFVDLTADCGPTD